MKLPNRSGWSVLSRSAVVGALATGIDFVALTALASLAGLGPRLASPFALVLGMSVQFVGNKLLAFEDRRRAWLAQATLFLAVEVASFAANLLLFELAMRGIAALRGDSALSAPGVFLGVRALTQATVYFGLSFPLWARIFAAPSERAPQRHASDPPREPRCASGSEFATEVRS